jgi:hypothetical protein
MKILLTLLALGASAAIPASRREAVRGAEVVWAAQNYSWATWSGIGFCRGNKNSLLFPAIDHNVCIRSRCAWSHPLNSCMELDRIAEESDPRPCFCNACDGTLVRQFSSHNIDVSFIFIVKNNAKLFYESILEAFRTAYHETENIELLVYDDASVDDVSAVFDLCNQLKSVFGIKFTESRNTKSVGFIASANSAVSAASGRFVVLFGKEVLTTPGWLAALRHTLVENPGVGLVGPIVLNEDLTIHNAGGVVYRFGSFAEIGGGLQPLDLPMLHAREVDFLSPSGVIMFRRSEYLEQGLMDWLYKTKSAAFRDASISFARVGLTTVLQPLSVVVLPSSSLQDDDLEDETDNNLFQTKFSSDLFWACPSTCRAAERSAAYFASLYRQGPHVLVLDNLQPEPDHDSGSVRMLEMLRILKYTLGYSVSLETMKFRDVRYMLPLLAMGINVMPFDTLSFLSQYVNSENSTAVRMKVVPKINYCTL